MMMVEEQYSPNNKTIL